MAKGMQRSRIRLNKPRRFGEAADRFVESGTLPSAYPGVASLEFHWYFNCRAGTVQNRVPRFTLVREGSYHQ